jgi:signal transduction histidine kinase
MDLLPRTLLPWGFAALAIAAVTGLAVRWGGASPGPAAALAAAAAGGAFLAGARLGGRRRDGAEAGALEAARLEAARARDECDDLQRTLAHDLRSPLGAIVNFVSVLEEDHRSRLDPEALGIVARIRRAAEGALRLADGLARLTKVSREAFRSEPVDVEALVREVFDGLDAGDRVELSLGELPPAVADRALLREAFSELLRNGVKFSAPREKARIAVGGRRAPDGGSVYWVADDGVGFAPGEAARLFRAFQRLHATGEFPGAGVGLAVVRRVAERHGGSAWAESSHEGGGARFFLALPPRSAP